MLIPHAETILRYFEYRIVVVRNVKIARGIDNIIAYKPFDVNLNFK